MNIASRINITDSLLRTPETIKDFTHDIPALIDRMILSTIIEFIVTKITFYKTVKYALPAFIDKRLNSLNLEIQGFTCKFQLGKIMTIEFKYKQVHDFYTEDCDYSAKFNILHCTKILPNT